VDGPEREISSSKGNKQICSWLQEALPSMHLELAATTNVLLVQRRQQQHSENQGPKVEVLGGHISSSSHDPVMTAPKCHSLPLRTGELL
jgi:hypothetical protein